MLEKKDYCRYENSKKSVVGLNCSWRNSDPELRAVAQWRAVLRLARVAASSQRSGLHGANTWWTENLGSKRLWNQEEKSRTWKEIGIGRIYSLIRENRQRRKDLQTVSVEITICGSCLPTYFLGTYGTLAQMSSSIIVIFHHRKHSARLEYNKQSSGADLFIA